jgi:multidrug resistance efflux pump
MPTPNNHPGKDLPVTAFLALAGALILAGVATFGYFGGYWWQYWQQIRDTAKAPERRHWMETRYCNRCGIPHTDDARCRR